MPNNEEKPCSTYLLNSHLYNNYFQNKSIHPRTNQTDELQKYKNRIRTLEKDYEKLEVKYEKLKTETLRLKSKNQEQN